MPDVVPATLINTRVRHTDGDQVSLGTVVRAAHHVEGSGVGAALTYEVNPELALLSVHFDSGLLNGTDVAFVVAVDEDGAIVHDQLANDD